MPRVKCPQCATIVTHAASHAPICPTCGFGGPSAPAPATAIPGFSSPPADPGPPPASGSVNGLAVAALVCGIAGFILFITAPIAVVLGIVALNQRPDGVGRALAITGLVLGALVCLGFLLVLLFFAAVFGSL